MRTILLALLVTLATQAGAASEKYLCEAVDDTNSKYIVHIGETVIAMASPDKIDNKIFYVAAPKALVKHEDMIPPYMQWNAQTSFTSNLSIVYWIPSLKRLRAYYFAVSLDKRDENPRAKLNWEMQCVHS